MTIMVVGTQESQMQDKDKREGKGRRCCLGDGIDTIPCPTIAIFHQYDYEEKDAQNKGYTGMDALKKWVIIRITTYSKMDVFQNIFFKLTLLLNGQCGLQVCPKISATTFTFSSLISMLLQYDKSSV